MADYLLRDIPPELWRQAKATAAMKGESLRDVLIRLLQTYVKPSRVRPK